MTDDTSPSPPALIIQPIPTGAPNSTPPAPDAPSAPAKPRSRGLLLGVLGLLGFLILAGGEAYLYLLHQATPPVAAAQIAGIQSQLNAVQNQLATAIPAANSQAAQATLGEQFVNLNAQVQAMQTALAADHGTLTQLAANNTDLTKLTTRIETLNRLETARMALETGKPLGDIPNAPPALAKFATAAPPTEAELVLNYPAAAQAANTASVANAGKGSSLLTGALARVESLVTISKGDHVLIGAPAAAITAAAGQQLNAGDLAGAVAMLTNGLSTNTQAAMGDWLPKAQSLIAARAAIISMGTVSTGEQK